MRYIRRHVFMQWDKSQRWRTILNVNAKRSQITAVSLSSETSANQKEATAFNDCINAHISTNYRTPEEGNFLKHFDAASEYKCVIDEAIYSVNVQTISDKCFQCIRLMVRKRCCVMLLTILYGLMSRKSTRMSKWYRKGFHNFVATKKMWTLSNVKRTVIVKGLSFFFSFVFNSAHFWNLFIHTYAYRLTIKKGGHNS